MRKKRGTISVIIPVFNEEDNVVNIYKEVKDQLKNHRYEFIFVNDGSADNTQKAIEKISSRDKNVKLINLSKNFGHQIAITCGLDYTIGDATIIMDADMQDPPSLIPKMIAHWEQGYDVVYGIRSSRDSDSLIKKSSAVIFYKILATFSGTQIPANVGDFRLISKSVVATLRQTREYQRFLRGIISWVGFRQIGIEYKRPKRYAGQSKYSSVKMVKLGLDAILSFSFFPLRIASLLGLVTTFVAVIFIFYALYVQSIGHTVRGWSSTIVLMLFLGSIQLIAIGIIGEYLGRIYEEVKKRPLYIIKSAKGVKTH